MRLKLLINRCLLTCVAAVATLSANAYYDFESNGIYYVITDSEAKMYTYTIIRILTPKELIMLATS